MSPLHKLFLHFIGWWIFVAFALATFLAFPFYEGLLLPISLPVLAIAFRVTGLALIIVLAIPFLPVMCALAFYLHPDSSVWRVVAHLSVVAYWFLNAGIVYLAN